MLKDFSQFINENQDNSNSEEISREEATRLFNLGLIDNFEFFQKGGLDEMRERLESLLGVELVPVFSSIEEDSPDEDTDLHYVIFEFSPEPVPGIENYTEQPTISIYENETVQLMHDATPYPSVANTQEEASMMSVALIPSPVPIDKFTKKDYDDLIDHLKHEYGEDEEYDGFN
jgi:hypothetical protein